MKRKSIFLAAQKNGQHSIIQHWIRTQNLSRARITKNILLVSRKQTKICVNNIYGKSKQQLLR